jgi:hypothetical protein
MSFCEDMGFEHKMLAATIAVNDDLLMTRPAAIAPDEIDQVLKSVQKPTYHSNGKFPLPERNGHVTTSAYIAAD